MNTQENIFFKIIFKEIGGMHMKAKAKHDVKVLMEDNRFSNFVKGNEYRCMKRGEDMILIDEDKCGYITDMKTFNKDFDLIMI